MYARRSTPARRRSLQRIPEGRNPWSIAATEDGSCVLRRAGIDVCPVSFPRRPSYYDAPAGGDLQVHQLVAQYSAYALALFLRRSCVFWRTGHGCHFCSVESTRRNNRQYPDVLPEGPLLEAVKIAFDSDPSLRYLEVSAGAHQNLDEGFLEATGILAKLRGRIPPGVRMHLNIMPPWNLDLLERLEPVDEPTFAMEVWGREEFASICPGKQSAYGWNRFLEAFRHGVRIFGEGRLSCNFVAGLEPVGRLVEGIEFTADHGVVPQVAIFHPDRGTPLADQPAPSVAQIWPVVAALRQAYRRHGFRPYMLGSRRASVDGEIYQGYFDD